MAVHYDDTMGMKTVAANTGNQHTEKKLLITSPNFNITTVGMFKVNDVT